MSTQASIGYLQFYIRNLPATSPQSYIAVEEVVSVSNLGFQSGQIDVTNFDSTAGYKEFIADLKEGVEVTVTCNQRFTNNTGQLALYNAAVAGVNREFRLTFTAASPNKKVNFTAAITGFKYVPSVTTAHTLEFTLKISGDLS